MKLHELKIKEEYWNDLLFGAKTFELRRDDRNFKVGDLINFTILDRYNQSSPTYQIYKITYILCDCPQYGLKEGYCILGLKVLKGN